MMQMIAIPALALLVVAAAVFAAARSAARPMPQTTQPTSPLDHAERILAARYARGMISSQEYERMLAVLRR